MALRIEPYMELLPGYRLIERLGSGGFGEVWKAEAPGGVLKAVKIIFGSLTASNADESYHAEQELQALKRVQSIRHPYLLSIDRYDIIHGRLVIVTELADGNLWDRFEECRRRGASGVPRSELLRYLEEAAEALDLMNIQHRLQHLDIKPQNLFLIHNHVKVADFGLVKDLEAAGRPGTAGGVTAVYGAPETFDGGISRYCDQYSLAIVYQELLTGVRPYDGSGMQDLMMQHMEGEPDLLSLPEADRPAVARALSKRAEDRFPTCLQFVQALRRAAEVPVAAHAAATLPRPGGTAELFAPPSSRLKAGPASGVLLGEMPAAGNGGESEVGLSAFLAPPAETGSGALMPALVVALGQTGRDAVLQFRAQLASRYGGPDRLPSIRFLYVDTDPDSLDEVSSARGGAQALVGNEVLEAPMNRSSHYQQSRRGGHTLVEGWFDQRLLNRIRRTPTTMGVRAFGRLAFLDHYRRFARRVQQHVQAACRPDSLAETARQTGLELRTNSPRVYVVAGLGGGTGGGMFLDAGYALRKLLRSWGYGEPDVIGLLCLPDSAGQGPQRHRPMSNAYAALKELRHYCRRGTKFEAVYDDSDGKVRDPAPPFRETVVLAGRPADPAQPGDGGVTSAVADHLRRDLLSPLGRRIDDLRDRSFFAPRGPMIRSCGVHAYTWPRGRVLETAARRLCRALAKHWLADSGGPDLPAVQSWVAEQWTALELAPEALVGRFQAAAQAALDDTPQSLFDSAVEEFKPTGWLGRTPKIHPHRLRENLDGLRELVGIPEGLGVRAKVGRLEHLITQTGEQLAAYLQEELAGLIAGLLEHAGPRLAGAEAACQQLQSMLEREVSQYEPMSHDLDAQAVQAYYLVNEALSGMGRGAHVPPAELVEALKRYPDLRYQALKLREACRAYNLLRANLTDRMRELEFCRRRVRELLKLFDRMKSPDPAPPGSDLMPPGCPNADEAAQALLRNLTEEERDAVEVQLQRQVESRFGSLFRAVGNPENGLEDLRELMNREARSFLDRRLSGANVVEMFFARYHNSDQAVAMIQRAYEAARPPLAPAEADPEGEITVLGLPPGEDGEPFQLLTQRALGPVDLHVVAHADEILFHREYPEVDIDNLPGLGRLAADAYHEARQLDPHAPHTRIDVAEWDADPKSR